jgi:hypothetical protein
MNVQTSTIRFRAPQGFEVHGTLLQDFERGLT